MSTAELQAKQSAINDEAFARAQTDQDELFSLFQKRTRGNLTSEEESRLLELQAAQQQAFEDAESQRAALLATANRELDDQLRLSEAIAAVSPAEAFRGLSTALARADYWSYRDLAAAAEEYRSEVDRAREEWQEDNPQAGGFMVAIGPGGIRSSGDSFEPPTFDYSPPTVGEQLSTSGGLRDLASLLGFNVLAFVGAYVAFLRYDVR